MRPLSPSLGYDLQHYEAVTIPTQVNGRSYVPAPLQLCQSIRNGLQNLGLLSLRFLVARYDLDAAGLGQPFQNGVLPDERVGGGGRGGFDRCFNPPVSRGGLRARAEPVERCREESCYRLLISSQDLLWISRPEPEEKTSPSLDSEEMDGHGLVPVGSKLRGAVVVLTVMRCHHIHFERRPT